MKRNINNTAAAYLDLPSPSPSGSFSLTSDAKPDYLRKCALELKNSDAAKEWKNIGRRLGVDDSDIDSIEDKEKELKEAFYQMIRKWRSNAGKNATFDVLIEALQEEKLNALVPIVESYKLQDMSH